MGRRPAGGSVVAHCVTFLVVGLAVLVVAFLLVPDAQRDARFALGLAHVMIALAVLFGHFIATDVGIHPARSSWPVHRGFAVVAFAYVGLVAILAALWRRDMTWNAYLACHAVAGALALLGLIVFGAAARRVEAVSRARSDERGWLAAALARLGGFAAQADRMGPPAAAIGRGLRELEERVRFAATGGDRDAAALEKETDAALRDLGHAMSSGSLASADQAVARVRELLGRREATIGRADGAG